MRGLRIATLVAALGAALFISGRPIRAADITIPIYFQDSRILLKADVMNRTLYVPIKEIIARIGLPFTDSQTLETLTIRQGNNQLVVTKNSALISYNGQIILLPSPMLREDNRWLAPVEFLTMGLTRMSNIDFRYRPGSSRVFAGNFATPELEMNAQTLGPITRLTLRCEMPIKLDVKRDDPTKAILAINRTPLDPVRERLDHRDRLLRSVSFDDSDGESKLVLDITRDVSDVRVTSTDNNRIFFVDLLRKGEPISAAPAPAPEPATTAAAKPDTINNADRRVRVIVIDPGHGGMDNGVRTSAAIEKDLTLAWARRLRSALQMQLGATVLLTRDSDVAMDNEARSTVANNNQANLFISLHVGYSNNKAETTSSIFVMKDVEILSQASAGGQLFMPWYLGHKTQRQSSAAAASVLQEEVMKELPDWKIPVRSAPLAVLSSATMPSLLERPNSHGRRVPNEADDCNCESDSTFFRGSEGGGKLNVTTHQDCVDRVGSRLCRRFWLFRGCRRARSVDDEERPRNGRVQISCSAAL
jgi:N-acetylmuramoyl-L-alanine amidase